jgi:hypothetical protein
VDLPADALALARSARAAGVSFRRIADALAEQGLTTRTERGRKRPARVDPAVLRRALARNAGP